MGNSVRGDTGSRGRSWLSAALGLVAVSLVALGLVWWWQQPGSSSDRSANDPAPTSTSGAAPGPATATPPPAKSLRSRPGDPTRLSIPALDVAAPDRKSVV